MKQITQFIRESSIGEEDIVVYYGRFNPPHSGHLGVVKRLAQIASSKKAKAYITLSGSVDSEKNPLPFDVKLRYVKAMVRDNKFDIEVFDKAIMSIYDLLKNLAFEADKTSGDVYLMCGSDRMDQYQKMADSMVKKYRHRGELQNTDIICIEAMSRNDKEAYSASQMRASAISGNQEEFVNHCPFKHKDTSIKMYDDVRKYMNVEESITEAHISHSADAVLKTVEAMAEKVSQHTNDTTGQPDKLWQIGGSVRDYLLGKTPNDYDLITSMYYKSYAELFGTKDIRFRGRQVIVVPVVGGEEFETACLHNGEDIKENLQFRDLTINSMAMDMSTGEIIDPEGGQRDIKAKKLRLTNFMRDAIKTGGQPVAVLRAIRFFSVYGWDLTPDSIDAIQSFSKKNTGKLTVTPRQFEKDWTKLIKGSNRGAALQLITDLGFHDNLMKTQPAYKNYVG